MHKKDKYRPIRVKNDGTKQIRRRLDFNYLNGHGTFYTFDPAYFTENLLDSRPGEHLNIVVRNLHTNQLDSVRFKLESYSKIGRKYIWIRGFIDDIDDCFQIKIEYNLQRPLESHILVYASARPDYGCFERL